MERIKSESFEKVLYDNHGIEWFQEVINVEAHNNTTYSSEFRYVRFPDKENLCFDYFDCSEEELIGIMVIDLFKNHGIWLNYTDDGDVDLKISKNHILVIEIESPALYEALKTAVESIDWKI